MKAVIREEIYCDKNNLKKYLPARYASLASLANKNFNGQTVNLIYFPVNETITGKSVMKSLKKIKNTTVTMLYFAWCFTIDAKEIISENNGVVFVMNNFPWTDDRYHQIRSG